jgi:hypothetical protein
MEFRLPETILLIILILSGGCTFFKEESSPDQIPPDMDAQCELQEINLTLVQNQTIVPLTEEDIRPFPEFGIYMQNRNDTLSAGNPGWRVVKNFECNESRARSFLARNRKFEEDPNQPVMEYHRHYFRMSYASFWGTTARPTIPEPSLNPTRPWFPPVIGIFETIGMS